MVDIIIKYNNKNMMIMYILKVENNINHNKYVIIIDEINNNNFIVIYF